MRLADVDRRFGEAAEKWVWTTGPFYAFEVDGRERESLEPVEEVLDEHFEEDENSWWTCHKDTKMGDLAVMYRSGAANEPGNVPRRGPKDLRHVVLATSDARPLRDDPLAGEFADYYGCQFVPVAVLHPPISLNALREDSAFAPWSALRTSFVRAAAPMPEEVWRRLLAIEGRGPGPPRRPHQRLTGPERRQVERRLEQWLADNPQVIERLLGFPVQVIGTQVPCGEDHGGVLDVLVQRTDERQSYVVLELKAADVKRDAIAQALGYVGWLRSLRRVRTVRCAVIGLEEHPQVQWICRELADDLVSIHDWRDPDLPVPPDLMELLEPKDRDADGDPDHQIR